MRQTSTYKTVDELPNLLDKAKQPEFKSVDDLPDLKKKVSGDGSKEPSDGGLNGTTSTTDLPTISQDELDKQGDIIGRIQEADSLSKATRDISMPSSGKGGANITTIPDYNSITKSKEILNSLKGEGYNDDDIAVLTETFRDLPAETETYGKDAPYSKKAFLELYKENPIAAITKANNVKNYFSLLKSKGQEKASEFNQLAFQDDPSVPVNKRIDRFDNQKAEQKKLIEENLSGAEKDKALQRIDRNASIILGNIFNDPQKAKEYLEQKMEGKDIQLKNPTILESKSKVEGDLGNFSLRDIAKNIDEDSPAQRMAYDRYKYSSNLSDALNNQNIYDAAIGFAAAQDDRLAAQIDKLGGAGLPKAMQGQLVSEFMNLPEVKQRAEQDPEYAASLQQAKNNLYFTYPEFAKKEVGQKIAQAREYLGYNNWFANVPTKGGTDELVDKLISEGKMTEQDKLVYQSQIRPSLGAWASVKRGVGRVPFGAFIEESPIPTSGLLETTQNSMNKTIHGMARSIEDAINAVSPGEPFSDKERLYSTLKENSELIPLIPREGFHEAVMGTGNLTGFVIPMIAGGAALKGVKGAEFINNALLFEGENKSRALELFPNNETAQYLYTGTATIGDMTLGKLIPTKEAGKGFGDLLKKDITETLNKFTNQEISAAAAKQNILEKAYDIVPKFLKENTKTAAVITGFGAFHNGLDALFGGNDMSAMDVATQAVEDYKTNFLSTGVLSALAVKGKQSGIDGKMLMEVSSKPDVYERVIKDEANLNPELASSAKEKIDNLKDAAAIRKDLDKTDMTDVQKEKYLITALNKKILERKASETSDQSLKEKYKKEAEQHNTDNLILQAEFGDKEFKDLTPEEKERIELPKGISIKTQPSGTEGKFTPYIVNENGEHEVLNRSFDTPEAAKIYGEDAVKRKYFDNNIKNKKEELPEENKPTDVEKQQAISSGEDWSRDVESTANKLKETEQKNPSLWQKIKDAAKNVLKSIKNIGKYEYEKRKSFVDDIKFEEYPNDKEGFIELWKDGKKIGEMNVHYGSDNNLGIKWVSIKPEFRGKGLSLLLYGKATEIAKEKGFNGVASGFSTHETAKTNSLYKHFNLIDLGESKGSNDGFNGRKVILHDLKDNTSEHNAISEAYHKAKADGSNPELVKAVEDLLGKPKETKIPNEPITEPVTKPIPEVTEATKEQGVKEAVPEGTLEAGRTEPEGTAAVLEGERKKGITHAAVEELRKIIGEPEYEGKPVEKHIELIEEAQKTIAENPNAALEVIEKMEAEKEVSNKDNAIAAVYKATLDAALEKNPTKELLKQATRLAKALDVSGTKLGKALESRKLIGEQDNLANFLMQKQAAQGTELTENQIKEQSAKYNELKEAKEALEKQLELEREQHKKDIAELGLNKAKAKARREAKKTDAEYKAERKSAVEAAREALKQIRDNPQASAAPLFRELVAIAPHVKEYLNSLASQGVDKLDNIISEIHAEFKDVLDGLTTKNVLDILAGEYDKKNTKITKNETASRVRLLQREAKLIKELADAKKGLEKAKTEQKVIESNRRIDELKEKIKEVKRLNKEGTEQEPVEDLTAGSNEDVAKYEEKLLRKIDKLNKDLKEGNYLKEPEKEPIFKKTRKAQILEDRVIDLENKIRHERSKDEYNKRSKLRKGFDKVMEVLGVRRLVQSALDISVPFRQGATMLSPRKIDVWAKGFRANLQSIFNPKKFERIMHEIRNDPMYHEMKKDNVVFNDMGSADPNLHNEDFRKSFIYKIPILSEPLKASNRSADAFLNVARYEMYKKLRANLERKGFTREADPKAFKYIGNWTMSMTGRGKMHSALEKPAMNAVLGNTFYGARLMASRLNLLNPVTYFDPRIPKEVRYEAMKDMAAFTSTMMTVATALAYTTGAKISLNPDDSDFLQLRYGNKVYDISGGLANYVRTGLRIMKAAYTKSTGTKYEGRESTKKAGESVVNFFRNKLSPNTSYAVDAFFGGRYGQDFDPSDIYKIYPMYTEDFIKAWKEEGGILATSTVLVPNIIGIGYGSYASKGQIDATLEDLQKRNMRSDEMDKEKIHNYNEGGRPITMKEFDEFVERRDKKIGDDLKILFDTGINGTPYKDLTHEQVVDETNYIKSNATKEVKEEMFGKQNKTKEDKKESKKLLKERKEKYQNN